LLKGYRPDLKTAALARWSRISRASKTANVSAIASKKKKRVSKKTAAKKA